MNIPFVKKKHFFCDCEHHLHTFVVKCSQHEMFFKRFDVNPGECKCKDSQAFDICGGCITKMFILNHIVYKVCIATPSFRVLAKIKNFEEYLKECPSEAFSYFNKETGEMDISLDNPKYNDLVGVLYVGN